MSVTTSDKPPAQSIVVHESMHQSQTPARATREILDKIEEKLSEERGEGVLANLFSRCRWKSLNCARNRPPLADALFRSVAWTDLRSSRRSCGNGCGRTLGDWVLEQAREQSAEILGIGEKRPSSRRSALCRPIFGNGLAGGWHAVEKRAQELATELTIRGQQSSRRD